MKYHEGALQAVPLSGGPFFQSTKARSPPSPTSSEEEMWEQVDGRGKGNGQADHP